MKRLKIAGLKNRSWMVQWVFVRVVQTLNKPGMKIRLVKSLKMKDRNGCPRTVLGMVDPDGPPYDNKIFINAGAREHETNLGKAATLFHETLHIIMPPIGETHIGSLEEFLWKRLTAAQKEIIASYFKRPKKRR